MLIRPFETGDFDALVRVVGASVNEAARLRADGGRVQNFLSQPRIRSGQNVFVGYGDGENVLGGFAAVRPQPDIGSSFVTLFIAREDGDLAMGLIEACAAQAQSKHKTRFLRVVISTQCEKLIRRLKTENFAPVESHFLMRYDPATAKKPPVAEKLPDYEMRLAKVGETDTLRKIQNTTFADHFEYSKNTVEDAEYFWGDLSKMRENVGVLCTRAENTPIGYIITSAGVRHTDGREGWIEMLGVLPNQRGKGLGRYLVAWAMARLLAKPATKTLWLEVADSNQGALKLYQSLGFQIVPEHNAIFLQRTL